MTPNNPTLWFRPFSTVFHYPLVFMSQKHKTKQKANQLRQCQIHWFISEKNNLDKLFDCSLNPQYNQWSCLHWSASTDTDTRHVRRWVFLFFLFLQAAQGGSRGWKWASRLSIPPLFFFARSSPSFIGSYLHKEEKKNWRISIICVCVEADSVVVFNV